MPWLVMYKGGSGRFGKPEIADVVIISLRFQWLCVSSCNMRRLLRLWIRVRTGRLAADGARFGRPAQAGLRPRPAVSQSVRHLSAMAANEARGIASAVEGPGTGPSRSTGMVLEWLDPADQALAMDLIRIQGPHAELPANKEALTPTGAANIFLTNAAKSGETPLLNKALEYIGRMRASLTSNAVPSLSARNELIRACGREMRRLKRESRDSGVDTSREVMRYLQFAEGLYGELLDEGERKERDAAGQHGLDMVLSSMIYVYCQAGMVHRAISIYDRLSVQGVRPDKWAAAGMVKALAAEGRPKDALALLDRMEKQGQEVLQHAGLYVAIMSAITRRLEARPPTKQAQELRRLADRTVTLMRAHNVQMTRRMWQRIMQEEAASGKPKDVRRLVKEMERSGLRMTPAEYSILIEAHAADGDVKGIDRTLVEMREKGLQMTQVMYLCLIKAYGRCKDADRAKRAFEQMRSHNVRPALHIYTMLVRILTDEGRPQDAWEVFQDCIKNTQPDDVLYSVALRTATAVGGCDLMTKVYQDYVKQNHGRPDNGKVLNSLMAGYVDCHRIDDAFRVLQRMKDTPGVRVDMVSYNVLIHGLVKEGRLEEVRSLAEEARRRGLSFDDVTMKALAQSCKSLGVMQEELLEVKDRVQGRVDGAAAGNGGNALEAEDDDEGANGSLVVDLHGLTVTEAQALLSSQFKAMRAAGEGSDMLGLKDLVIITGYGKLNAAESGDGVLKIAVKDFLACRSLYYYHPNHNGGRFVVPRASFRDYIERLQRSESELKFMRLALYRYLPIMSVVALWWLMPPGLSSLL